MENETHLKINEIKRRKSMNMQAMHMAVTVLAAFLSIFILVAHCYRTELKAKWSPFFLLNESKTIEM